ncbi:hypothetical protein Sango_0759800 [Sesamum angolense]|uniref:Gag1-like clamp domain-containing protein n=3 Tax=Sesamum TaxID=4181 RepID=A0AAE1X215_9LAMI|nr:hypothetical protein Sango_0759800 [Sesamum angolense]
MQITSAYFHSIILLDTNSKRRLKVYCLQTITKGNGDMMEVNSRRTSHSNDKKPLENSTPPNQQKKPTENSPTSSVFVNHAAIAWNEGRRKWVGNASQRSGRTSKDQIISWSTTYEDLLSNHDPFPEPIPLPEMVDFLVDIWQDEGLFD